MTDPFLHRRIDTGEITLHVAEARPAGQEDPIPAEAPLVVLLHGFPEHWWSWRHQLTALAKAGIWAVAPDLRGYGESDKPGPVSAYEVEKLAGDVAGLIRALGRDRATVVGHDWGAVVAWVFAQEHPALLERLAILNVPHPVSMMKGFRTLKQLKKSWYVFFFQIPFLPEWAIRQRDFESVRRTFQRDGIPADETERFVEAFRRPGVLPSAIAYYRAAMRRVLTGRVPKTRRIEQDVLVIWGDRDHYLGKELAEPPARWVPNARVVHLPDASHWVQNDAPDRVNELLVDFVAGGARRGG